jgi:polyketide biosynthesis enoyl-CoA hydratase PksH
MNFETITIQTDGSICYIRFMRSEQGNSITRKLISEVRTALEMCKATITVVVLEGSEKVFCLGTDFEELHQRILHGSEEGEPELLYELWQLMAAGPYIVISHVKGRANAGGIGFVAASDIVIADSEASFSLSELLFGLLPACVLPFLVSRVGFKKANYLALSTAPITALEAKEWGLVDICSSNSDLALRKQLARLRRISKPAILRQKSYCAQLNKLVSESQTLAASANREVFTDSQNLAAINRYVEDGRFPWDLD